MTTIFPAIDLLNKKVVRLTEGVYGSEKIYSENPLKIAKNFEKAGFEFLHIVDLDGAKSGKNPNFKIVQEICSETNLKIQIGGGIRNLNTSQKYFNCGVSRIIIGSAAIKKPELIPQLIEKFGLEKIVLGLDVRQSPTSKNYEIFISGWTENSGIPAEDFLKNTKATNILMTDISKDGKLEGPNISMYKYFTQKFPNKNFIASGGVSNLSDIKKLQKINMQEIIVGKAIYEGKIELEKLLKITKT